MGKTYKAVIYIKPNDEKIREVCDDFKVFVDDKEYSPYPFLLVSHTYLFDWDFTAVYDELKSVNLGDSITAYTGNYVDFPETIGVKTQYGSITMADVTWTGTDSINTSTPAGNYEVTAKLTLPNNVTATEEQKNRTVTVKVRSLINSVTLKTVDGNVPAKSGESLPTSLNVVKSNGASLVENSFSVSPNDETAVKDTEYTITAKVKPDENCEFAADTIFTINGISMNASPAENGEYELTYTFTAEEVQSYDVIVNGGTSQKYKEGDTVNISTSPSDFYKWTAETVYEATETVEKEDGSTEAVPVTYRNPVNIFEYGDELKAETSFIMPKLADGRRLEITAEYVGISYDMQTGTATVMSDNEYTGVKVIFASYLGDRLVSAQSEDVNLKAGSNTVTAPESFTTAGADNIKVMVWDGFDSIKPLFEHFEK
ncbi:MAG: Ig-like domain-containing protein [Firmicutes bacterium]|nr:Ig-like domain-containing protein [Bacillota bacterium]